MSSKHADLNGDLTDREVARLRQAYVALKAKHELLIANYATLQGEMAKRDRDADRPKSSGYAAPWDEWPPTAGAVTTLPRPTRHKTTTR